MTFNLRLLSFYFLIIFGLFNISIVFGAVTGACCYSPSVGIKTELTSNSCLGENEIKVGVPDFNNPDPNLALCGAFENKGQGCIVGNLCYASVQGKKIFDIDLVKGSFDFNSYCEDFVPISNPLCSLGGDTVVSIGSGSSSNSGSGTGSGGGVNIDSIFNNTKAPSSTSNLCSQSGLPFGFYVTKDSCEAINLTGGNSCIFNPYLGGQLNAYYSDYGNLGLDYYENSCIPTSEINTCYDYKTKDNCETNPAIDFSSDLIEGCKWVPASDFTSNIFNKKGGICISKSIDENKYYNKDKYSFRMNLISNSGFEEGSVGWVGGSFDLANVVLDTTTFEGNYLYKLNSGNTIEQSISDLSSSIVYSSFLYARVKGSISPTSELNLVVKSYDKNNVLIKEDILSSREVLSDIFVDNLTFKRVDFNSYKTPDSASGIKKLVIGISAVGVDIEIDAVDFEPYSDGSAVVTDNIYKPVEILSYEASNCNLCFDKLKLNLCTQTKSDLLGDCSYLVSSPKESYTSVLKNYTGSVENVYSKKYPWESQSLANSNLFCELYLNSDSCTDSSNYVNSRFSSIHLFSGETLCKWDTNLGCYKDSNNDNLPDTLNGLVNSRAVSNAFDSAALNYIDSYAFKGSDTLEGDSDFALSCDTLPPNSYLYFTGRNLQGVDKIITSSLSEMVGGVNLNLQLSDAILSSCQLFDIQNKLYVDYEINGLSGQETYRSNLVGGIFAAKDYFKNSTGSSIFVDGENDISIFVKDQSGNVGKEWKFNLNVDANAPEIKLMNLDEATLSREILGPSTYFNFSITDYSKITSCNYVLTPKSSGVPAYNYQKNGSFDLSNYSNSSPYYKLDIPIFDSSANGDFYNLDVTCKDLFDQVNTKSYIFKVDFNTAILVLNPKSFRDAFGLSGFMNSAEIFSGVSSEYSLNSCSLDFTGYDFTGENNIVISNYAQGFYLPNLIGYDTVKFFYNLSGNVDFTSDGKKVGKILCSDNLGNKFVEDLIYYYDTIDPRLVNYSLDGVELSGVKSVVDVDGKYYTHSLSPGILNVSFDGTGSWIKDDFKIGFANESGLINGITASFFSSLHLKNNSFVGNLLVPVSLQNVIYAYTGIPVDSFGLHKVLLSVNYSDKADNVASDVVSYYYDSSKPKLVFSGDVAQSKTDSSTIFSSSTNPNIVLTFNAPTYRTYTCSMTASFGDVVVNKEFETSSNVSFKLKDISNVLYIDKDTKIPLSFSCRDIYGLIIKGDYLLVYDNTAPILRAIFLDNGNEKFYRNYENAQFSDISDSLVFDLVDTSEVGYSCNYKFVSTPYYSCNEQWFTKDFAGSGYQNTENLLVVKGTLDRSDLQVDPLCVRTNEFFTAQAQSAKSQLPLNTNLVVKGVCEDRVGFKTIGKEISVNINYILSNLASLEFEYKDGFAYPIVKSFDVLKPVVISPDFDGRRVLVTMNDPVKGDDGMYVYRSDEGIDISMFENGVSVIYAIALDSSGGVMDRVAKNMVVDSGAPSVNVWIPDESNGIVYSPEFELFYSAEDKNGQVQKVEVYLEDSLIFSSDDTAKYDARIIREPDMSLNRFSYDLKTYVGQLGFIAGGIDRRYTFKVRAYDTGGNMNESSIDVSVRDGVGITLLDSVNSFVDPGKFSWITKTTAPMISFKTSKTVTSCSIYPFIDDRWVDVFGDYSNKNVNVEGGTNTNTFSFDLSTLNGYDVSSLDGKSSFVKVVCLQGGNYYNYTRELRYIDSIPDYVLSSSEGFVFNEEPYGTQIEVKSVGPYRHISCDYRVDGAGYQPISVNSGTKFARTLDFSTLGSGEHTLNVLCRDLVGNLGPEKSYKFLVNKGLPINIVNLSLSDSLGNVFAADAENNIYLSKASNLNLEFVLNKKNGVQCSYVINPAGNFVTGAINFVKNLFSIGVKEIASANVYKYVVSGLSFEGDLNVMKVTCDVAGMSDSVEKSYNIIYDNTQLNVSVNRVAIE